MNAAPTTSTAPRTAGPVAARARDDAIRRLSGEFSLLIMTGRLTTRDVVTAVEDSWRELTLAGAPVACLPEFVERLARVRLAEVTDEPGHTVGGGGNAHTDRPVGGRRPRETGVLATRASPR